jgi:FKBP-type peptidyl-prolyl cis-trans isomerase
LLLLAMSSGNAQLVDTQSAQVGSVGPEPGIEFVLDNSGTNIQRATVTNEQYITATDEDGKLIRMVIDDIKTGHGAEVVNGDKVLVHYTGTFESGQEFDNSRKRGQPLEFTVGAGQVIAGWEEGLLGMRVGGERVLVIPPEKAYGQQGIGPIPGNATLVFTLELLDIIDG